MLDNIVSLVLHWNASMVLFPQMQKIRRFVQYGFIGLLVAIFLYGALLARPDFLYQYQYQSQNVHIYSDQALPSNVRELCDKVLERIKKSSYYQSQDHYKVFISNEHWRWRLVANLRPNAGGFNVELFPNNSFIRPSVIAENRIIPPRAVMADAAERDLAYFISHEITHGMMVNHNGLITSIRKTHLWIKEGYADLIGKHAFDYDANLAQLRSKGNRLQVSSGLYVRYHLALSYLLEKKGMSLAQIIDANPTLEDVIDEMLMKP